MNHVCKIVLLMFVTLLFAEEWRVYNTSNSDNPMDQISFNEVSQDYNVWFGRDDSLVRFDGENFLTYTYADCNRFNLGIRSLAMDDENTAWIGIFWDQYQEVLNGIVRFDGNSCIAYNRGYANDMEGTAIHTLLYDKRGYLWIGRDDDHGVLRYGGVDKYTINGSTWDYYTKQNSGLPSNDILSLAVDHSGNLWVGTYGDGVAKFDGNSTWEVFDTSNSDLPHNRVRAIAEDHENNIWFGTWGGGVARYNVITHEWNIYTAIVGNYISSIVVDGNGTVWMDALYGIAKYTGTGFINFDRDSLLRKAGIVDIACDSSNNLWIGTIDSGLVVFNENEIAIEKAVKRKEMGGVLEVYPNPFNPTITIRLSGKSTTLDDKAILQVYDILGTKVKSLAMSQAKLREGQSLDIIGHANGVYVLECLVGGKRYTKKLLYIK